MIGSKIRFLLGLLVLVIGAVPTAAEDSAEKLFEHGLAVLAEGDFEEAFLTFRRAAQADAEMQTYREHAALVRRIQQTRGRLKTVDDPKVWEKTALSLRAFYYDYRVYGEALALDRERYSRAKSVATATDLAQSQLEQNLDEETEALLARIPAQDRPVRTSVMLGIALARQGKKEAAAGVVRSLGTIPQKDPALLFDLACLCSLLGDQANSGSLLKACFEQTPPSRLAARKAYAGRRADLVRLRALPEAKDIWKTASKVAESDCSSGSDCGTCPKRGGCDSGDS